MTTSGMPIVLVHGGGHGAWCWAPTVAHLEHPVLAVDLPPKAVRGGPERFASLPELSMLKVADFAASVLTDADAAGLDRFVLVGHSLAGLTIPEVARRAPDRVAHLVFVSCAVPPEGGAILDGLEGEVAEASRDGLSREDFSLPEEMLRAMFCNDLDDDQTQFVLDHFGTEVMGVITEPVTRAGLSPDIPKTYVRLSRDQALAPAQQDEYIANLEASPGGAVTVTELDAGHNAMIGHPRELAEILDRIATAAR
jgi:pimeloyl-ACP methyl ester carboxylesterase